MFTRKRWNGIEINVNDIFAYSIATEIMDDLDETEPKSVDDCRQRSDWPKWKETIQVELKSLMKRKVFSPIIETPKGIKPVGYKWVFMRKEMRKMKLQDTRQDL